MNPWDENGWADGTGPRRKRPTPSWGCALAAITGSVTTVVVVLIIIKLLAGLVDMGELMP